jgi:cytochrome oxidase Cu insertion factor (SCO1/SenC/PrrC family)
MVKARFLLLGACVAGLGVVLGTLLWLKLGPFPAPARWEAQQLARLQHYGAVPDFSFVERSGKVTTRGDLRGKISVVNFIYTSCNDTCPLQTAAMANLQEQFKANDILRLVSISVDPENDTPQALSEYASRYNAAADRWFFLTGAKDHIFRVVQEGFRLSAASGPEAGVIHHSPRFVLVDKELQIRGYYDSRDPSGLTRLRQDLETLLK